MKYPKISVIIPTYNSERMIHYPLKGILLQNYPKSKIETIIIDNNSKDNTREIAKKAGAVVLLQNGKPPQVCKQRNLGAKYAHGQYLIFLDHDMEMSSNLLLKFAHIVNSRKNKVSAWYIREKVVGCNRLISDLRTFEKSFYHNTIIGAVRIINKTCFKRTKDGYDKKLSSTSADWDMDNQLKLLGCKFGTIQEPIYHHEENLTFWTYINKKANYMKTVSAYRKKWKKDNILIYDSIVKKQYNLFYRLIGVFVENGKWKKLIKKLNLYIFFVLTTVLTVLIFYFNRLKNAPQK